MARPRRLSPGWRLAFVCLAWLLGVGWQMQQPALWAIGIDEALVAAGLGPVRVTLQRAPAWTTDWMTEAAKDKLRAYGIAPPHACASAPAGSANVVQFAARSAKAEVVHCPQCGSANTTETSHFGSTACKALYRCLDCMEPFDYFKPY